MEHRTFGQCEVRREEGVSAAGCFAPPIVTCKALTAVDTGSKTKQCRYSE